MENIDDGFLVDPYKVIYRVYALPDENHCITDIWSTGNRAIGDTRTEQEMMEQGYVLIDEGSDGEIYGYAQVNYLPMKHGKPTYDEKKRCNFSYVDEVHELTEEEKEKFFPPIEPEPSELEKLKVEVEVTAQAVQDLILMTMGGE